MTLSSFLGMAEQFAKQLNFHHAIEEQMVRRCLACWRLCDASLPFLQSAR